MTDETLISKDKNKEIENQYIGELNKPLYGYLRRHYTTHVHNLNDIKYVQLFVGHKMRLLNQNKKYLTNQIFNDLDSSFDKLSVPTRRTTIKKFLSSLIDFYF